MTHPLKGSLICGRCRGRMGYGKSRGKGGVYEYFFCLGRHTGRTTCDLPYVSVEKAENAVLQLWYEKGKLSTDNLTKARVVAIEALDEYLKSSKTLLKQQGARLTQLERKKQKLIDAYLDDALSAADIKARQLEIQREISNARDLLVSAESDQVLMLERLDLVLQMLANAADLYATGNDTVKRNLTQAMFDSIEIDLEDAHEQPLSEATDGSVCRAQAALSEPLAAVVALVPAQSLYSGRGPKSAKAREAKTPASLSAAGGSNVTHLAVTVGFEPTVGGYPTQLFESCTFGRSDTSPPTSLRHATGSREPAASAASAQPFSTRSAVPAIRSTTFAGSGIWTAKT
jgi:site-specific DNA recombinase